MAGQKLDVRIPEEIHHVVGVNSQAFIIETRVLIHELAPLEVTKWKDKPESAKDRLFRLLQKASKRNKDNNRKQVVSHFTGTKSYARITYEKRDHENDKEFGGTELWKITHFVESKGWVDPYSHEAYEEMLKLQSQHLPKSASPLTEDEICAKVLGTKSGYIRGCGPSPKPSSSSSGQQMKTQWEEAKKRIERAESRAEQSER